MRGILDRLFHREGHAPPPLAKQLLDEARASLPPDEVVQVIDDSHRRAEVTESVSRIRAELDAIERAMGVAYEP